jgi:hypothetical protein
MDSRNGLLKMFVDLMSQKSFLCTEQGHIRGRRGRAPFIHNLCTTGSFTLQPLYPEERGPVPIKYYAVGR